MSTALTSPIRTPADARAEAERLVGRLNAISDMLMEAAAPSTDECEINDGLVDDSRQLLFAADLLADYAHSLVVKPISSADRTPDTTDVVLVWSDDDDGLPWLGWYDGKAWWYVDSAPIQHVTRWAYRPEEQK